jgi:predicted Zn-dependent peptidase
MNAYYYQAGNPDGFQADLDRYRAATAEDIKRAVQTYLLAPKAVLSVVPKGKPELAAGRSVTP